MTISDLLDEMCAAWSTPRSARHRGQSTDFKLRCTKEGPEAFSGHNSMPAELRDLWRSASSARLFEDVDYGQWGLVVLSPVDAASDTARYFRERARDAIAGDLVIGRFLGDQDLLIIRTDSKASDFGHVLIALPLDPRADWYRPAATFELFLRKFRDTEGDKFWEER